MKYEYLQNASHQSVPSVLEYIYLSPGAGSLFIIVTPLALGSIHAADCQFGRLSHWCQDWVENLSERRTGEKW